MLLCSVRSFQGQKGSSNIKSILVISKSKGFNEIFWNIRTSTYQICRTEEKINRTMTFHK